MPGRPSRRSDIVAAALELFTERGYEATSVADIAAATHMTKAAFSYHFPAKDDLLQTLADPLLQDLSKVVAELGDAPEWPNGLRRLLERYLRVLIEHAAVVEWIDGDKAVLRHPTLGRRLQANNRAMRRAITGGSRSTSARLAAAATLGTLWRPLRNLGGGDFERHIDAMVSVAMTTAQHARADAAS